MPFWQHEHKPIRCFPCHYIQQHIAVLDQARILHRVCKGGYCEHHRLKQIMQQWFRQQLWSTWKNFLLAADEQGCVCHIPIPKVQVFNVLFGDNESIEHDDSDDDDDDDDNSGSTPHSSSSSESDAYY